MAHKRSSKRTSFGKKSGPEKDFIKRGRKSRDEASEDKPKRTFGKASGFSSRSSDKFGSNRFSKSVTRRSSDSEERPKRSYGGSSASSERAPRKEGDRFVKKDFRKSDDSNERPKRPFSRSSDAPRSRDNKFGTGDFKKDTRRPSSTGFSKRSEYIKRSSSKPFSKESGKGDDESMPKKTSQALGFTKRGKSITKTQPVYPAAEAQKQDGLTRLNKHIANSGMGSRREADEMIKKGLISVNGITITEMGFKVKPGDVVRYEDKVLKAEKPVYVLLNKPKGFITTTDDPQERKTVMNLVASACKERLYPVGRLDRNTTGLLLLTNDGDLAAKLTHPSFNTKKIYKVELDKPLTKADLQKIQDGVHLSEGRAIVDDVVIVSDNKKEVGLELHIGWNRIVRRIFESLEYQVVKLDRVIFAGLDKKELPRGEWRFLKPEEVVRLKHFK